MAAALLLAISLLLVAYSAIGAINVEGFQSAQEPNVKAFNDFKQLWGTRAVQSGLINPRFFSTYQSILDIPGPIANIKKEDFDKLINNTAQIIKVWYINAQYGGNPVELSVAIDASKPTWAAPPSLPIKPVSEEEAQAIEALKAGVDFETGEYFLPVYKYYKIVIEILTKSGSSEQQLVDENPDIMPMSRTFADLEALKTAAYSEAVKYSAALTILPKNPDTYLSTLNFLIKKADQGYNLMNNIASGDLRAAEAQAVALGSSVPGLSDLQGATPQSLGVSIAGFSGSSLPLDLSLGSLSGKLSVSLDNIKREFEAGPKDAANKYMRIAQTRRKLLNDLLPTFTGRLNTAKDVFRRYEQLKKQMVDSPNYEQALGLPK